ncbi:MAG: exopolyphosphatase, partial [Bacteroidota bacterium]
MRLAAIDIGTNACRLLISEVITPEKGSPRFNKLNLVRVPLRLGFDVFETGEISKPKKGMILQTMKAYAHLMNAYR